ncbi:MAG: molybdopterin-dependent oxidoreductase [Dehalococcoidales bacterium]|nr:molybdopterin-dependent oxidoreductase [Dehalococcoidales bacterium]
MKKLGIFAAAVSIALIAVFAFGLFGCQSSPGTSTVPLGNVEVREYQGEDLSSVNDFRENSIKGPQYIDIDEYQLQVTGLVENPTSFTYDEVVNDFTHYQKAVILHCVEGWSVKILWEGMQVRDIIARAGPLDEAKVVIFHAYDGYTTSFPIEFIMDNPIIMAYKMNEIEMPAERGYPFALVAESKWGYKWIKWVTQIELSDDINYKGFWEERGFSNSGNISEGYFN